MFVIRKQCSRDGVRLLNIHLMLALFGVLFVIDFESLGMFAPWQVTHGIFVNGEWV